MTQTLNRVVRAFVAEGSGLAGENVIPGNDPAAAPSDVYCSVLPTTTTSLGYPDFTEDTDTQTVTQYETRRRTYSVQWWRPGAEDAAERFAVWTRSHLGLDAAERLNIRPRFPISYQRLDGISGDRFEERVVCTLEIDFVSVTTQAVPWIDEIRGPVVYDGRVQVTETEVASG